MKCIRILFLKRGQDLITGQKKSRKALMNQFTWKSSSNRDSWWRIRRGPVTSRVFEKWERSISLRLQSSLRLQWWPNVWRRERIFLHRLAKITRRTRKKRMNSKRKKMSRFHQMLLLLTSAPASTPMMPKESSFLITVKKAKKILRMTLSLLLRIKACVQIGSVTMSLWRKISM